jgi:hypothetical protein
MKQTFTAISQGGKLEYSDPERLRQFLILNTGPMVVHVGKERRMRSNGQNRYFYGQVLQMLSDHTGYTVEELKQWLKKEFGWTKVIVLGGKQVEVLRSSADMSTAEFEKFMTQIRMLADTLGCHIAEPNSPHFSLTE